MLEYYQFFYYLQNIRYYTVKQIKYNRRWLGRGIFEGDFIESDLVDNVVIIHLRVGRK